MEIRRVRAGEGALLRELRLKSITDAPYAFSTTLAEAEKVTSGEWEERAVSRSAGESIVMFVAVEDGQCYGMAGGFLHEEQPGVAEIFSMWVDPRKRRSGIGRWLVEAVIQWAQERGARSIDLWVTRSNEPARALYRRVGFSDTDDVQRLPSNETLEEILMRREL